MNLNNNISIYVKDLDQSLMHAEEYVRTEEQMTTIRRRLMSSMTFFANLE